MPHYSPWSSLFNLVLCVALCNALAPRRVYRTRTYPRGTRVHYASEASEAPEPAPLPALALEVPPKAEVVERV